MVLLPAAAADHRREPQYLLIRSTMIFGIQKKIEVSDPRQDGAIRYLKRYYFVFKRQQFIQLYK